VICYKKTQNGKSSRFQIIPTTGDVPMARSGHSVVAYGKYMFLFGGTVFSHRDEDANAFSDLYIFCTGSFPFKTFIPTTSKADLQSTQT
jgi:hypothetical protein